MRGIAAWTRDPDHSMARRTFEPPTHLPAGERFPGGIDGIRSAGNGFVLDDEAASAASRRRAVEAVERATSAGVPPLDRTGSLPAGIHAATRGELLTRFGGTPRREELLTKQLPEALRALERTGVEHVVIGGSLVGAKPAPGDLDLTWLPRPGVHADQVDAAIAAIADQAPDVSVHRADRIVLNAPTIAGATAGENFLELYQHDRVGARRGVVLLSTSAASLESRSAMVRDAVRGLRLLIR